MKRVFVSYSRSNAEVVTQLIQDIQAVGIDTWHDQTLTGGQRWWDNILLNIRECDVFICTLSPESWESEACKSELSYAVQLNKTILPVLVADGINVNLLPAPLNEIQVTDYRRRDKGAAFALIKCIHTASPSSPLPDPLPPPPKVPVSYLSSLTERIDSGQPLDAQEQITILFELEAGLREGRSPTEVRDLLLRFRRRDDLLAKVAVKIEAALRGVEERTVAQDGAQVMFNAAAATASQRDTGSRNGVSSEIQRSCPRCTSRVDIGAKFCSGCGSSLPETGTQESVGSTPELQAPRVARSKIRRYSSSRSDSTRILGELKSWLKSQSFECQEMITESSNTLLQIKKQGGWRDFVGMATSLNIVVYQSSDTLTVEIGAGKWIDKAAVGTVGMAVLWPLAITAGVGAWEQAKMPDKIFDYVASRLTYR